MRISMGLTYSRKAAKKKLAIIKNYKFKPSVVKKVNRLIFFKTVTERNQPLAVNAKYAINTLWYHKFACCV